MNNDELTKQLLDEFNKSIESVIYENERSDVELNTEHNQHVDFVWIEGLRTGSRLVYVSSEENIYYSNARNTMQLHAHVL